MPDATTSFHPAIIDVVGAGPSHDHDDIVRRAAELAGLGTVSTPEAVAYLSRVIGFVEKELASHAATDVDDVNARAALKGLPENRDDAKPAVRGLGVRFVDEMTRLEARKELERYGVRFTNALVNRLIERGYLHRPVVERDMEGF